MKAAEVKELLKRTGWTLRELGDAISPPMTERSAFRWTRQGVSRKRISRQLKKLLEEARRGTAA